MQTPSDNSDIIIAEALQQAVAHHKAGQLPEAESLYRAILQVQPLHPDANHNLGVLTAGEGNPNAALPFLKTALEADPAHGPYWMSYIEALLAAGKAQDAQSVLEQGMQLGLSGTEVEALTTRIRAKSQIPSSSPAAGVEEARNSPGKISDLFRQAVVHHQANQLAEAEELYRQIVGMDDRHAGSLHLLGVIASQTGRHQLAIEMINQAIALDGRVAEFHSNLGIVFQALGKLDDAIACYEQALAIKPNDEETLCNLGNALNDLGKLDDAIARYEQALIVRPNNPEVLSNLGSALRAQGKVDDAIARFEQALAIKPNFPEARTNLGIALRHGKSRP